MTKRWILLIVSVLIFATINIGIYQKEKIKKEGQIMFLPITPADPRSIMQGDYMRFSYRFAQKLVAPSKTKRGYIVLTLSPNKVGKFEQFDNGETLTPTQMRLRYHNTHGRIKIVPDSFMFQEGHAKAYEQAKSKYAVFKFDKNGNALLIDLADEKFSIIKPKTVGNPG